MKDGINLKDLIKLFFASYWIRKVKTIFLLTYNKTLQNLPILTHLRGYDYWRK